MADATESKFPLTQELEKGLETAAATEVPQSAEKPKEPDTEDIKRKLNMDGDKKQEKGGTGKKSDKQDGEQKTDEGKTDQKEERTGTRLSSRSRRADAMGSQRRWRGPRFRAQEQSTRARRRKTPQRWTQP